MAAIHRGHGSLPQAGAEAFAHEVLARRTRYHEFPLKPDASARPFLACPRIHQKRHVSELPPLAGALNESGLVLRVGRSSGQVFGLSGLGQVVVTPLAGAMECSRHYMALILNASPQCHNTDKSMRTQCLFAGIGSV